MSSSPTSQPLSPGADRLRSSRARLRDQANSPRWVANNSTAGPGPFVHVPLPGGFRPPNNMRPLGSEAHHHNDLPRVIPSKSQLAHAQEHINHVHQARDTFHHQNLSATERPGIDLATVCHPGPSQEAVPAVAGPVWSSGGFANFGHQANLGSGADTTNPPPPSLPKTGVNHGVPLSKEPPQDTPSYVEISATADMKRFQCECGHKTKTVGDMERHHESRRHSEPKYKCVCGKKYSRKDGLTRHKSKCGTVETK